MTGDDDASAIGDDDFAATKPALGFTLVAQTQPVAVDHPGQLVGNLIALARRHAKFNGIADLGKNPRDDAFHPADLVDVKHQRFALAERTGEIDPKSAGADIDGGGGEFSAVGGQTADAHAPSDAAMTASFGVLSASDRPGGAQVG